MLGAPSNYARALAVSLIELTVIAFPCAATTPDEAASSLSVESDLMFAKDGGFAKSASTNSLGSRGVVNPSATLFGAFEIASATGVYILVRGNSLGTLGVTQNYLDAPRVRVYNGQGQDLVTDTSGRPGFNSCLSTNSLEAPVFNYYQITRGQPAHERDSCVALSLAAGAYTFSVTPSISGVTSGIASTPSSGEILFEVTLGASAPALTNHDRTAKLLGGTWTYTYTLGVVFNDHFTFTTFTSSSPDSNGDFYVSGTDAFGTLVVGGYYSTLNLWDALNRHSTFDEFYTFTFSDNNHVSGCYYFVQPAGSTNIGSCHPLVGSRTPSLAKSIEAPSDLEWKLREGQASVSRGYVEPGVLDAYLRLIERGR